MTFQKNKKASAVWLGPISILIGLLFMWPDSAQAAGASLKISPVSGTYEVGSLVDVSFVLDTGGEAINALNADILFPADKMQVVNPVASTSFISIWVTAPTYSNADGTLHFQGGLPNPGIKTSAGVISTVTFRVKSAGTAVVKFAPTSKTLRNDGEGTNILTSTGTANFTLKVPPPAGPIVTSPTHSDTNQWYNNNQPQFTWEAVDKAVAYSYLFDQSPKQIPPEQISSLTTGVSQKASGDGVWYFHIRAKTDTWGGVTSFPVHIDTTPPAAFKPTFDQAVLTTEEIPTLRWLTTDAASGVDHYEVKQLSLDGKNPTINTLFVEANSPYTLSKLGAGEFQFLVRAIDRAGNSSEGTANLRVVASGLPFYARVPLLKNPAVANTALITLLLLAVGGGVMMIMRRVRIRATFRHDFSVLQQDAQRKAAALERELAELRQAQQLIQPPSIAPPPTGPMTPSSPPPIPPT